MSGTTHDSPRLNQASAHDTGLYDPAIHDNQIVALYDTDAQARAAEQTMQREGFPASCMKVLAREGTGIGTARSPADEGLWGSIRSLFVPDSERSTYDTAIARGHAMLVVTPGQGMDRQRLIHALETTNPLDFDAKLEEWRQAGYDTTGSAAGAPTSNRATAGHAVDAGLNTAPAMGQRPDQPTGYARQTAPDAQARPQTGARSPATDDTIKVMEERLRVGKREVAAGAVRVRSYIVERPVEEQVRLHEERVSVERRPVDRPATAADFGAFQERTIEARATSEEPVISKEARVVEEIGLKKVGTDRTETVRDTVRKTEVEVQGDADGGSLPGRAKGNPNATPNAQTSGANSPRK